MGISDLINNYARDYSPYMRGLINHLPMGQLALYFMTNDLKKVEDYSNYYMERSSIDSIKDVGTIVESIDECLGKRDLYEPLVEYFNRYVDDDNIDEYISYVLNTYPLGMSSGIFHTLIRLAYAVEGYEEDKRLLEEVKRALAYYVTGYREAGLLSREIAGDRVIEEMKALGSNQNLRNRMNTQASMGKKMRVLYNSSEYMNDSGFIIQGYEDDKIKGLLDLILPAYINSKDSGNIIILHCITGLHALMVLKDSFKDFDEALDIITTCIVTHLMTIENLDLSPIEENITETFDELISKGVESRDVHTIKLTYSSNEIYRIYNRTDLKIAALKRISNT